MKQLAVMLVLLTTVGAVAQRHEGPRMGKGPKMNMTAEQMATLKTKKLTLALDLTKAQQTKVMDINLDLAEYRKAKFAKIQAKKESGEWKRPTSDERFAFENARLDHQIAHQQKMKEVLTKEQYQTWKKLRSRKGMNGKKKMQEKGRRG
ncbi:hypothetical protein [Flagellimonas pacifica]|uniref:DUF4890 domain-containing protein n=1 Tax=Flagellimonas pacifica TaxID=1247520 RepID=A0A285M511_9FLAO|nr:hypothetical protein [Allomuricauda parva]SNY92220.1 hypothetical protein SAMN06265377_0027 [Allomuricauda parva]